MLNETVEEFLDDYCEPVCGSEECPCGADHYRTLLSHLFGPGILKQRTSTAFGRRVKTAVKAAFPPDSVGAGE